jgi:signal transduction histidine kinase
LQWWVELFSSVLDARKLEAGEGYREPQTVAVLPLIREAVLWARAAAGKGIEVREALENEDILVRADEASVRRILMNLLHNAVKFTVPREESVDAEGNKGLISVGVQREGAFARIGVQDTGPGIPAEFLEKIFTRFGQVQPGLKKYSTGLGLYFCKLAVEAQGGKIGVDSEVGKGSTFWFTLPLA